MTSTYRREHFANPSPDEFERLTTPARNEITTIVATLDAAYPTPVASNGERRALERACARYLIDSGKASAAGVV